MFYRRPVPLGFVIYLLIGVLVAAGHGKLADLGTVSGVLSALLAILVWPLVLLGVHLTIQI